MARLSVAQALLACGRASGEQVEFDFPEAPVHPLAPTAATARPPVDESSVLHVLRIRGFVTPTGLEASLGEHPAELLAGLVDQGLVRHVAARDMFGLLPAGRARQEALLDEYATTETVAALHPGYREFLVLNDEFKTLCSQWQVRDDEPNDHADADYDGACVARLLALNDAIGASLAGFATALPRLARYADRLGAAAARVVAGEPKQFTGVMCESYHDIWMELHEDLIVLQRIDRTAEGSF